jgi:hypothetical protein
VGIHGENQMARELETYGTYQELDFHRGTIDLIPFQT